jgi:hypothetical protein
VFIYKKFINARLIWSNVNRNNNEVALSSSLQEVKAEQVILIAGKKEREERM